MSKEKEKSCFVIMPISDQDGYDKEHFNRVYEHIIKPSCIKAGFNPKRADEENKSNYIVIDILRKIIESDMVLCDLSAKNPNVFYELGIRQAFNKKTVLIKDKKTSRVFDIQGLRTIDYDESLRIDTVQNNIEIISRSLIDTHEAKNNEVNSLIQLLSIQPAKLNEKIDLSNDSILILKAIEDVNKRISSIEKIAPSYSSGSIGLRAFTTINSERVDLGDMLYINGSFLGKLAGFDKEKIYIDLNGETKIIKRTQPEFSSISTLPF